MRKETSTLLVFSAAVLMVLLASPLLPLSNNILLQPAQAQTTVTFKTPTNTPAANPNEGWTLTFDAQGTACSSYCNNGQINSGTFQFNDSTPYSDDSDSGKLWNGETSYFNNDSSGLTIVAYYEGTTRNPTIYYQINTACSTSDDNSISINELGPDGYGPQYTLNGAVECTIGGGNIAAEPSSSPSPSPPPPSLTAGSPQDTDRGNGSSSNSTDSNSNGSNSNGKDSDSDGIPDSSDNCPNHPHHRCFIEGDTGTTTTSSSPSPSPSPSSTTGTTTQDGDSSSSSSGGGGSTSSSTDSNSNGSNSNGKDSDSDGIPDSSDNCPNHPHHRCFIEAGTSSGTTNQPQSSPSSPSSNRTGNQTR